MAAAVPAVAVAAFAPSIPAPAASVPACAAPLRAPSVRAVFPCAAIICAAALVSVAAEPQPPQKQDRTPEGQSQAPASAGSLVRIVTLEDEVVAGESLSIGTGGRVALKRPEGGSFECRLDGIRRIVNANPAAPPSQTAAASDVAAEIFPRDGGRIFARTVRTEGAFLLAEAAAFGAGARRAPLTAVAAIGFGAPPTGTTGGPDRFKAALKAPAPARDRLFLIKEGKALDATGALVALGEKTLSFRLDEETLEVPLNRVRGIVLAAAERTGGGAEAGGGLAEGGTAPGEGAGGTGAAGTKCVAKLRDGSEICGGISSLEGGRLEMRTLFENPVFIPWDQVESVGVRSDRLVYLSDMDPVAVEERPAFNVRWGYRRDASIGGGPISIRKNVYEKGLGVHSKCDLTYDLGGRFRLLLATVGIDDSSRGLGDCVFRVLGDGAVLLERRARGTDAPISISVKIEGVKRLTLSVDFGDGLDIGDHADWADCRLLK
ncbi:MAG: NPCBM/NEW2 domain-containing protein [Planctomycetota bacterium]|nr:NPCBM/NEW2 domain-containing protein [Planctomycetota bacterium]